MGYGCFSKGLIIGFQMPPCRVGKPLRLARNIFRPAKA
jgi:hypothetical protein